MRNFERYEKEIKEIYASGHPMGLGVDGRPFKCNGLDDVCDQCQWNEYQCSDELVINWLYEEYKPKETLSVHELIERLKKVANQNIQVKSFRIEDGRLIINGSK